MNVASPLAELEAQQFPLIQSCVFPKLVSTSDEVRKASAEAERRLDSHALICRFYLFILSIWFLFFSCAM
jgi:thimet oligopeptidase